MQTAHSIELEGVRVHNLKNLNLRIRRNTLTVICGVSGSGKSSLAFDTLFAEGQRRYVETFSPYARQFLDRIERPDADRIEGIPPAIAIRQNVRGNSSRSTVGTRTELLNYLRPLFAELGTAWCPDCEQPLQHQTAESAADILVSRFAGSRAMLTVTPAQDQTPGDLLQRGFVRGIANHSTATLEDLPLNCSFELVTDRVRIEASAKSRLVESLEQAFAVGEGTCRILLNGPAAADHDEVPLPIEERVVDDTTWQSVLLSREPVCPCCRRTFLAATSESLNFLSPLGACPTCEGFGQVSGMTLEKVVPDPQLSLAEGAIAPWTTPAYRHELDELLALAPDYGLPVDVPFAQLSDRARHIIEAGVPEHGFGGLRGFHRWLVRHRYKKGVAILLGRWRTWLPCPDCHGSRLQQNSGVLRLGGLRFTDCGDQEVRLLADWLQQVTRDLTDRQQQAYHSTLQQLNARLDFLSNCGLGYLTLNRTLRTLSGGEAQRVALTAALGTGMINTLYVLDEPTSGLHPDDTRQVIETVQQLKRQGNTIVVVEHDPDFIAAADEVIEIGPQAGRRGGQLIFQGTPTELQEQSQSATAVLLAAERSRQEARTPDQPSAVRSPEHWLTFREVRCHNVDLAEGRLPLQLICAVTGVSGSGKSSLIVDALYPVLRRQLGQPADPNPDATIGSVEGVEVLADVVLLDQTPLPRMKRSIPATLIGAFDDIRALLAGTHEAKKRNYKPGMFSFNSAQGGRCEACDGHGVLTIDMQFLADVETTCEKCHGRRFRPEVLEVRYRDRSVHEILQMTAEDAFTFFNGQRRLQQRLNALRQAGIGYLQLGQPVSTLSGGESQRLRIAALLAGVPLDDGLPSRGRSKSDSENPAGARGTLFILDEPSIGLHHQDIRNLMKCLNHLVEIGHSIIVIEHDRAVIDAADYVIELGPGAGRKGGKVIAAGPP